MFSLAVIFLVVTTVASGLAENTKCSGEIEAFRKCREAFRESQKSDRQQESAGRQTKVKQCFTSSGCKEPTIDGKNDGKKQQCRKDYGKSIHDLIKPCVQKKLDIVLQEDDHENEKDGWKGFGDLHDELKTFCESEDQRSKTADCLKNSWKSGNSVNKEDREKKREDNFNANCANKRQCLAKISAECQTIFNKTKSARCDCAKSEVAPKSDSLNNQLQSCIGGTPRPGKDGKSESFTDRFVKISCDFINKEDKCSKPYQPNSHENGWKGKGKGSGRGGNRS